MSINSKFQRLAGLFSCFYLFSINPLSFAGTNNEAFSIAVNAETEISIERFSADGDILFIWQPHERGLQAVDHQLAQQLAEHNIEVWLLDLLEAYFLPNTASNMDRLPGEAFEKVMAAASKTSKTVVAAASGRGAIPVLRGIRNWQLQTKDQSAFAGLVLLSPKLYVKTPDPGTAAHFMPVTEASNLPVFILQPNKSPWYWKLGETLRALETSGSEVYVKPLDRMRDRFYFRPDAFEHEISASRVLWKELKTASYLLSRHPRTHRTPATKLIVLDAEDSSKKERKLQQYKGDPVPPPLELEQLDGKKLNLTSLKGQVVLVNFWATWCPPCVHEMPSMQRLADKYSNKPFTILGVNMAETNTEVEKFLTTRVRVDFPIVMDRDGKALKDWSVFAFPTSYVLDKQGMIRFALFGSVEWDNPDIINKIEKLLEE